MIAGLISVAESLCVPARPVWTWKPGRLVSGVLDARLPGADEQQEPFLEIARRRYAESVEYPRGIS